MLLSAHSTGVTVKKPINKIIITPYQFSDDDSERRVG